MMLLPYGEEIMIVGRTMWTQSTSVTDRRADRITMTKTVQRIASHGNDGCNSCASLAGLVLSCIACLILLVIAPLNCMARNHDVAKINTMYCGTDQQCTTAVFRLLPRGQEWFNRHGLL